MPLPAFRFPRSLHSQLINSSFSACFPPSPSSLSARIRLPLGRLGQGTKTAFDASVLYGILQSHIG